MVQHVSINQIKSLRDRYPEAFVILFNYVKPKLRSPVSDEDLANYLTMGRLLEFLYTNRFNNLRGFERHISIYSDHITLHTNEENKWSIYMDQLPIVHDLELVDALWFCAIQLILAGTEKDYNYH